MSVSIDDRLDLRQEVRSDETIGLVKDEVASPADIMKG